MTEIPTPAKKPSHRIPPLYSCVIHAICALICLIASAIILYPSPWLESLAVFSSMTIMVAMATSTLFALVLIFIHLLTLENKYAIYYFLNYLFVWALFAPALVVLCYGADLPSDLPQEEKEQMAKKEVFEPEDHLLGVSSLVFNLYEKEESDEYIRQAPHLLKLEQEHPDILKKYLQSSPRWKHAQSDTFYAQLGHVEMVLHDKDDKHMGVVHVTFLELVEGDTMPKGYLSIKPGEKLPVNKAKVKGTADIALDLGGNYFLLLAWRGSSDISLGRQAINNAIGFLDAKFDTLANNPTEAQIDQLLKSDKSLPGTKPRLKLSQAPSQFGTYQAEIYANPGEPGLLILIIKDAKTKRTLRVLNSLAHYSDKEGELFLHEIPADLPDWMERQAWISEDSILAPKLPFFTIAKGKSDVSFDADFELWFAPSSNSDNLKLLLTKRYQVTNCDEQSFKESADKESESSQEKIPEKPAGPKPSVKTVIVPEPVSPPPPSSTKTDDSPQKPLSNKTDKDKDKDKENDKPENPPPSKPVLAPAPPVEKIPSSKPLPTNFKFPTKAQDLTLPNFDLLKRMTNEPKEPDESSIKSITPLKTTPTVPTE